MLRAPVPGLWGSQCQRPAALHLPEQHSQKASAPGPRQPSLGCVFAMCGSPCSVLPTGTVPAELGFQLSCSTQELQCQGKRLHERPSHPARAGICSHCWPHAPAIHHHSVSPHVCTVSFSLLHPTAMTASRRGGCLKPHTSPAKAVPQLCSGQAAAGNQSGTAGPTILGSGKGSSSLSAQP